jgi:hypothetical protein
MNERTQLGIMTEETKRLMEEWQKEANEQAEKELDEWIIKEGENYEQ